MMDYSQDASESYSSQSLEMQMAALAPGTSPPSSGESSGAAQQRKRRPRIAIELPEEEVSNLNKEELRKLKNRIAAQRARERSQQQVQELQAEAEMLRRENEQQKAVIEHLRAVIRSLQPDHAALQTNNAELAYPTNLDPLPFHPHHAQQPMQATPTDEALLEPSMPSVWPNTVSYDDAETVWMYGEPQQ